MIGTFIAFVLKNPIARKVALIGLALGGLWYFNKLSINHAFEQGKNEGARIAWVQAEEAQKKVWATAQTEIAQQYKAIADAKVAIEQERQAFTQKDAALKLKRDADLKATNLKVAEVEKALAAAPADVYTGLPPVQEVLQALSEYRAAFDNAKIEIQNLEFLRAESQHIFNKEIAEDVLEIDALKKDLDQTKVERDFYENAFHASTKKGRGFWHKVKRIVTLGLAR